MSKKRLTDIAKREEELGKQITDLKTGIKDRDEKIQGDDEEMGKLHKANDQMKNQLAELRYGNY